MAKNTPSAPAPTAAWNPENVTVTRQLNASFKVEKEKPYLLQFLSDTYVDESRGKKNEEKKGGRQYAAPTMVRVLDLSDGREMDMILSTIPLKRLEESYQDGAFIGACFRLIKHGMRELKNYADWSMDEIDGTGSPNYRDPAQVKKDASKYHAKAAPVKAAAKGK